MAPPRLEERVFALEKWQRDMNLFGFAGHALRIQKIKQFLKLQSPALAALDLAGQTRPQPGATLTAHLAENAPKYSTADD